MKLPLIPSLNFNRRNQQKVAIIDQASFPSQAQRIKQEIARAEENLTFELGQVVQELPPFYTRLLAGSISLLVFGALGWAYFSKVDEVAVGSGELIPMVQVRPVHSLSKGNIRSVRVKEGDRVKKDDVLVELDPTASQTELDSLEKSAKLIRENLTRLEAERTGSNNAGSDDMQNQLLTARLQEFDSKRAGAVAEANKQIAVINEAKVRLTRLQANLIDEKVNLVNAQSILINAKSSFANAQEKEQGIRLLVAPANSVLRRVDYLDALNAVLQAKTEVTKAKDTITQVEDKVISTQKDIASQQQEVRQAEQAYQSAQTTVARLGSQRQSEILTDLTKRREELTKTVGQLEQARVRRGEEIIQSPVTGTVYSVKVTTGGSPVQTGEELLSILPKDEDLLLEVKVLNRDIGFVSKGMKAKVKIATFPYQEFGTIEGTVVAVSPNAITDKDLGLVFPTRIKLNQHSILVRGQNVELETGMAATGEIVLRQKSILSFLLEPIMRRFSEAFAVR